MNAPRSEFLNVLTERGFIHQTSDFDGVDAAALEHRLIYNSATGAVSYDADGVGGAAQVQFATIGKYLGLSASSFALIWV